MMNIDSIVQKVAKSNLKITSLVGSGISKASGMPTFRGEDGMWNNYKTQDLATPFAFQKNPILVWDWYRARMRILLKAKPNPAHQALTKLEEKGIGIGVVTQNVDGLHEIAGTHNIVEIHGRIRYARCISCNHYERWDNSEFVENVGELPYCSECKVNLLRPDVVWFHETLNSDKWNKAQNYVEQTDLLFVIGTSGIVYPVASLLHFAKQMGAIVVEFNIEETPISPISDYSIIGPCEKTLPEFIGKLFEEMGI